MKFRNSILVPPWRLKSQVIWLRPLRSFSTKQSVSRLFVFFFIFLSAAGWWNRALESVRLDDETDPAKNRYNLVHAFEKNHFRLVSTELLLLDPRFSSSSSGPWLAPLHFLWSGYIPFALMLQWDRFELSQWLRPRQDSGQLLTRRLSRGSDCHDHARLAVEGATTVTRQTDD